MLLGLNITPCWKILRFVDEEYEDTVGELQIFTDATHTIKVTKGTEKCTQEPQLAKQLQTLYHPSRRDAKSPFSM